MGINTGDKICIVGGGPGGIGAALALKEKGYKNVVVYEQNKRVGGQALSQKFHKTNGESFVYELCAIQPLGSYYLNKIIKRYKLKYKAALNVRYYSLIKDKIVLVASKIKILTFFIKDPFFLLGVFKFLYFLIKYRFLKKPGFLSYKNSKELSMPFEEWIRKNTLYSLDFITKYTILGLKTYHKIRKNKIPALFCWKFLYQCLYHPMRYINGKVKLLEKGYQNLWEQAAQDIDVRCNSKIEKIYRKNNKIYVSVKGATIEYDKLIIAYSYYRNVLDCTDDDTLVLQKLKYVGAVRAAFLAKGGAQNNAIIFTDVIDGISKSQCIAFFTVDLVDRQKDLWLYSAVYTHDLKASRDDIILSTKEAIKPFNIEFVNLVEIHKERHYGAYFSEEDICDGILEKSESRQGKLNTYFTGEAMSGGTHAMVLDYSYNLVNRYF